MRFQPRCPLDPIKLPNPPGPPIHRPNGDPDPDCGKDCFQNCYDNRSKIPALRPFLPLIRFHCNLHCNTVRIACTNTGGGNNPTFPPPPGGGIPRPPRPVPPTCDDVPPECVSSSNSRRIISSPSRPPCRTASPETGEVTDGLSIFIPCDNDCPDVVQIPWRGGLFNKCLPPNEPPPPPPPTPNPCRRLAAICAPLPEPENPTPRPDPIITPGHPKPLPPPPPPPREKCSILPLPRGYGKCTLEGSGPTRGWVCYHPDGRPIFESGPNETICIDYPQYGRLCFDKEPCVIREPGRPITPTRPLPTPSPKLPVPRTNPQRGTFIPVARVPKSLTGSFAANSFVGTSSSKSAVINHPSIDPFKARIINNDILTNNSNIHTNILLPCESSGSYDYSTLTNSLISAYNIVSVTDIKVL